MDELLAGANVLTIVAMIAVASVLVLALAVAWLLVPIAAWQCAGAAKRIEALQARQLAALEALVAAEAARAPAVHPKPPAPAVSAPARTYGRLVDPSEA